MVRHRIPSVPRPPIWILPNRAKGTEKVTMLGVMLRMTMRSAGLAGIKLEDIVCDIELLCDM
jgi:hypothetical protein